MKLKLSNAKRKEVPAGEHQKLRQWYSEMLKRKDKEIDELKKTNELLMKTAMKRAETNEQLRTALEELRERIAEKNREK